MLSPAIHFNGNCLEAMELYKKAFDAKVTHIDYADDAPEGGGVMHSDIEIYGSKLNMSDSADPVTAGDAICLNVFVPDADAVTRAYDALSEEGEAVVPIGPQFFSPMYAAVVDKYGVRWQIIAP